MISYLFVSCNCCWCVKCYIFFSDVAVHKHFKLRWFWYSVCNTGCSLKWRYSQNALQSSAGLQCSGLRVFLLVATRLRMCWAQRVYLHNHTISFRPQNRWWLHVWSMALVLNTDEISYLMYCRLVIFWVVKSCSLEGWYQCSWYYNTASVFSVEVEPVVELTAASRTHTHVKYLKFLVLKAVKILLQSYVLWHRVGGLRSNYQFVFSPYFRDIIGTTPFWIFGWQ